VETNCFLSEFKGRWAGMSRGTNAAITAMLGLLLAGVVGILFFGYLIRANGLQIRVDATMKLMSTGLGDPKTQTIKLLHVYGYMVELAHGLFYLVLAPVFMVLGFMFVRAAHNSVDELSTAARLVPRGAGASPLAVIGRRNRWFAVIPFIALVLTFGINLYHELSSFYQVRDGTSFDLGYMQAPFLAGWVKHFNGLKTDSERLKFIRGMRIYDDLERDVTRNITSSNHEAWTPFVSPLGNLAVPAAVDLGTFRPKLDDAVEKGMISLEAVDEKVDGVRKVGPNLDTMSWTAYWLFFYSVITVEACFQAFAVWLVVKILFWLITIYRCLPEATDKKLKINPNVLDLRYRFGLSALDKPYNIYAALLLIGATVSAFNYSSNSEKATSVLSHGNFSAYLGQILIALLILVAAAGMLGPMALFASRMKKVKDAEIAWRNKELAEIQKLQNQDLASADPAAAGRVTARIIRIADLDQQIILIEGQRTWPHNNAVFKWLMAAAILFFGLPICQAIGFVPPKLADFVDFLGHCKALTTWLCSITYGFPS
jgi:hypothetical protein